MDGWQVHGSPLLFLGRPRLCGLCLRDQRFEPIQFVRRRLAQRQDALDELVDCAVERSMQKLSGEMLRGLLPGKNRLIDECTPFQAMAYQSLVFHRAEKRLDGVLD